jgi:hypothetical protein
MKNQTLLLVISLAIISTSCKNNNVQKIPNSTLEFVGDDFVHVLKGEFEIPELTIEASPQTVCSYSFPQDLEIIDYQVSPTGKNVAVIAHQNNECQLIFWQPGKKETSDLYRFRNGFLGKKIIWHPMAQALFVLGVAGKEYQIIRLEKSKNDWSENIIFSTSEELMNLIACPRPFITDYDEKLKGSLYEFRLFFGMDNDDGTFRTVSITETGHRFYQVIGPEKSITKAESIDAYIDPSKIVANWALPIAFHPAGNELIWVDRSDNVFIAKYNRDGWGGSTPLKFELPGHGTVVPTSNGLGLIKWQKGKPGIGIYIISTGNSDTQLTSYSFALPPAQVPDGKGIVGLTTENGKQTLNYLPVTIPLPDVTNAWMFIHSQDELNLFTANHGVFRPNHSDQIYKLYESENYYCDSYDQSSPTRPYLVTTDIFWELFGSAYQGLFIVKERDVAIPNFWRFINEANKYYNNHDSRWTQVFQVLSKYYEGDSLSDSEVQHIYEAENDISIVTGKEFAFSELKPRGHYTSTPEMEKYFKAFKYITMIFKDSVRALNELSGLPSEIAEPAETWINAYAGFIAPSRSKLVWKGVEQSLPEYCQYPAETPAVFPLSWGFDNEIFYSTIYHRNLPEELQITGPEGERLLPSGIDLAAVLDDGFAEHLLSSDYEKYPPLRKVINNLRENYHKNSGTKEFSGNIYNQWLNAIALQWTDTINSASGTTDRDLWQTKRLQTGLATWTTLRHATVLVNERVAAECGEGGFEEILMRAPRGYVEPDPYTFQAIADLFESTKELVSESSKNQVDIDESYQPARRSLYEGIMVRLSEAAKEARSFATMAEKEREGLELNNEECEKILYVAGVAEHLFLIFNSLANKDYALSTPDPMPKIVDIAGDGSITPYLLSAVGNATEWDFIVPFYGRKLIVKGSVYSYYEFESNQLINDQEWREKAGQQEFLPWVKPFITYQTASEMASTGY